MACFTTGAKQMSQSLEHDASCMVRTEQYDECGNLSSGHCQCGAIAVYLMWAESNIRTGTKVLLRGKHPWRGHRGRVVEWQFIHLVPVGSYPIVELENGHRCFVFQSKEIIRED